MKLTNRIHVVGGGRTGFGISGPQDCHVYLVDGGAECALIDAGLGLEGGAEAILENIRADGLGLARVRRIVLTHYHCDHVGAARELAARLDAEVVASPLTARALRVADEQAVALDVARAMGFYPADYHLPACEVHREMYEGESIQVGDVTLTAYDTPGHCAGHLSFLMAAPDHPPALFGGDLVFWGGKILLQTIHDCVIPDHARSVAKVAALDFDGLFPGHLQISVRGGKAHALAAHAAFQQLGVPPNAL
jgi:glyoxylase-like metal-dependent hydrolase (beta-lactamase superfamily II)